MLGVPFMCSSDLLDNKVQSTMSTTDEPECTCEHDINIAVGVQAAILLILLVVAIIGWVCTYCILMRKLRKSVRNNSR